jgi:23S rRNA (uracil1939-C5)-methyltransferase
VGRVDLARDLKFFHLFGFRLDRLQPVDMFPWTYHIECVAEMVREE